ncbi:MAG TPA: choice-of-anchor D domain-containing protein, partial [Candidatus Kapabacteria bacterium]
MKRLLVIVLVLLSVPALGQWVKVFTAPTTVTSGYFFNENIGFIGTGIYVSTGTPAAIYYTTDGGRSWTRSLMPNQNITGQFTDIWFRDRNVGYALLKQGNEKGWSGVYRTIDGGLFWDLIHQADFGVAIRETKRGIFFTDRFFGIKRSADNGLTFQNVKPAFGCLGLDFLDDDIGYSTGEAVNGAPHHKTTDGGNTWEEVLTFHESWTPYADPATRKIFYASEKDNKPKGDDSFIVLTADSGKTFDTRRTFEADAITGGIAGSKGCSSVVYVQGQGNDLADAIYGFLRSTDGGQNWVAVGGPSNTSDTRFAVTGRGAVVYAFSKTGEVWKTTNGGDGKLTGSVFPITTISQIIPSDTLRAVVCDSNDLKLRLTYSDCDTLLVSQVYFLDDNNDELGQVSTQRYFGKDGTKFDTVTVRYKPVTTGISIQRIRLRLRHADGAFEDTTITITIQGTPPKDVPLVVETGASKSLDFGNVGTCGADSTRIITITNAGCADMFVGSLSTVLPFSLESSFQPFTLGPGEKRQFLIGFKPNIAASFNRKLTITTSNNADSVALTGAGIEGSRGLELSQPVITTMACDSVEVEVVLHNTSCAAVNIDSLLVLPPFSLPIGITNTILGSDSSLRFIVKLQSTTVGTLTRELQVYSTSGGTRFDTILFVSGEVIDGAPSILITPVMLQFDSVSLCGYKDLVLYIQSNGCSSLRIDSTVPNSTQAGFTVIKDITNLTLPAGKTDSVIVRFTPNVVGTTGAVLKIMTSLGERQVILEGTGTNAPGILMLTTPSIPTLMTCEDTVFTTIVSNTTCDTLIFDSVSLTGSAAMDYQFDSQGITSLPVGSSANGIGMFTPSQGGQRDATLTYYFHTIAGQSKSVSVPLAGAGISTDPLELSLTTTAMSAPAGDEVIIPIVVSKPNNSPVKEILLRVKSNTDMLEPSFITSSYGGTPTIENGTTSGFDIRITYDTPKIFVAGDFVQMHLKTYLTDTLESEFTILSVLATDSLGQVSCTPSSLGSSTLMYSTEEKCGDSIISTALQGKLKSIDITNVTPNPTSGIITVTIERVASYINECSILIYDQ